jgi:hypothetical protein
MGLAAVSRRRKREAMDGPLVLQRSVDLSLLVDVRAVIPCYPVRQLGDSYPVRRWLDGLLSGPAMAGQENPQPSGEAL